ncbi:hypothetical protein DMB66_03745 [Actinoplanes sp. ATCC 53533]|nr:hypothetical protein DMB66_03745 [Actinoplanes sp. ATCC 53533]
MGWMAGHRAALRRYEKTGDPEALEEATARLVGAHRAGELNATQYAAQLTNMGIRYGNRLAATGADEDSVAAVGVGQMALRALPAGHRDRWLYLSNYAADLAARYDRFGEIEALEEAIERLDEAIRLVPPGESRRATLLSNMSIYRRMMFGARADREDLERSVACAAQAAQETAPKDPNRAKHLYNAGVAFRLRFEALGRNEDLDAALGYGSAAVRAAPDSQERARFLSGLGLALRIRFERTGHRPDLDQAVQAGMDAVRFCAPDHADRAMFLQNAGIALGARYEIAGDPRDLGFAMWHAIEAVRLTPADSPDLPQRLLNLGMAHLRRFEIRGDLADLESAIGYLGTAVRQVPGDDADLPTYLTDLGVAHSARFHRLGDLADLDTARRCEQQALELTPADHAERASRLSNLAGNYLLRFWRLGDPADLDAALTLSAEAVRATPAGAIALPKRLRNLGHAHEERYRLTGHVADLDEAIRCGLDAVAASPPGSVERADQLSALGFAHLQRALPLGDDGDDLDEGLRLVADALAATPPEHPDHPVRLANLGSAHRLRYTRRADPADLDEAIRLGTEALRLIPADHPRHPALLSGQSDAHYERFRLGGADPDADAMVFLAAEAVRLIPPGHADALRLSADLGETYRARARSDDDLRLAVEHLTTAVDGLPADHPSRAVRLIQLARAHLATSATDEALRRLREAAASATALPARRLEAARLWGSSSADAGDAADAFAVAVGLLPLLAWRGLGRAEREARLASTAGLASLATAWAIEAGRLETAVELLEQGRAVLWAQTLQTRTDLTALHQIQPELADELGALRARLDSYAQRAALIALQPPDSREQVAAASRRDAEAWDDAVRRVRSTEGFGTFLAPTPFRELRPAAANGPVVLVNVSAVRCDALIVTTDGVRLVPLPDLTEADCLHRAVDLPRVVAARDLAPAPAAVPPMVDLLDWLWNTIGAPVVAALDLASPLPRLWWSPTGPLSALPLHAAGALPDLVVSSYTPTLGALLRAGTSAPASRPVVLAVGMPKTPPIGALRPADLPGVTAELDRLAARLPVRQMRTATDDQAVPDDQLPTVSRVLDALGSHTWVHLACHGGQDPDDPSSGAVYLADGPLTVLRIAALDLRDAELAFLSACSTAVGGTDLRDEAIHLAAAMQVAGYRHVVATAWSISDEHTPDLVDRTYARLAPADGSPDAGRSARALHEAVAALRAELPDRPDLWAAYLHVGP